MKLTQNNWFMRENFNKLYGFGKEYETSYINKFFTVFVYLLSSLNFNFDVVIKRE